MFSQEDEKYQTGDPATPDAQPADVIISPDTRRAQRIPPGQSRTRKWPVLQYGGVPVIALDQWRFRVSGLVERPLQLNWAEFQALPRVKVFSDFHCVTRWSRLGNLWEGVSLKTVFDLVGVLPSARYLVAEGYDDGWTTNMPLLEARAEDVLLADRHDGELLSADHGGPVRLVVPKLYAWKSAKWLKGLVLLERDQPGLWEQNGYHNHGDPWKEDRFRDDL
jgi:DMSO/TMAO reductase YedYZ molybdopterin-dependent catalytic subunit